MVAATTEGVTADSPIPDYVDPIIIIEPVLGSLGDTCFVDSDCEPNLFCIADICSDEPPLIFGSWSEEIESPLESDSQDVLTDGEIYDQLVNMVEFDPESLRAVAYREQEV